MNRIEGNKALAQWTLPLLQPLNTTITIDLTLAFGARLGFIDKAQADGTFILSLLNGQAARVHIFFDLLFVKLHLLSYLLFVLLLI